jgi:hypothetical protein
MPYEMRCEWCGCAKRINDVINYAKRLEKQRCLRSPIYTSTIMQQRISRLRASLHNTMGQHPHCTSCTILFGPVHTNVEYLDGMCRWCHKRHNDARRNTQRRNGGT